jgi:hypothetical protein
LAHAPPVQQAKLKPVPKPVASLMVQESEPVCMYTEASAKPMETAPIVEKAVVKSSDTQSAPAITPVAPTPEDEYAQRRERERDCFRDAEARVRKKLTQLQASVRTMRRAMEHNAELAAR